MVCSKMKDLVVKGEWAVGDKIPSESDLAESFGVNRLTVRIALQRLNALGILETRVGDGSYVRSFDFSNHIAEISDFFVNQKILHDTQEYRWIIQSAAVKLAVQRQTPEVLEKYESPSGAVLAASKALSSRFPKIVVRSTLRILVL